MRIEAGFDIEYDCPQDVPLLLALSVHPSRRADLTIPEALTVSPQGPLHPYTDQFGNTCHRMVAPAGRVALSNRFEITDPGEPDEQAPEAGQFLVSALPDEALVYLLGSRYCETDRLSNTAWALFGHVRPGWDRVRAICDFAHERITFGYEHARPDKSAFDAYTERRGVCRDYAHLAVTLCRCMNIPARYCTGYLGDIGVPASDAPMDFSAWFDVYLEGPKGGRWYTFDARHNKPRIGRILMARGRDATDVALTTAFGPAYLARFEVITRQIPEPA